MNEKYNSEIDCFIDYIASQKGSSPNTINAYRKDLTKFFNFLSNKTIDFDTLDRNSVRGFLTELINSGISNRSVNRLLAALKGFIKFKTRTGYQDSAGILELDSFKIPSYLPVFLFDNELEKLIAFECATLFDYRDRAIIELFFSTGLRVSELVGLTINHFSNRDFTLKVKGKGNKERIVVYNELSLKFLDEYLEVRESEQSKKGLSNKSDALFVNFHFMQLSDRAVRTIINKRIEQSAVMKNISPHSLRHSFATSMLRNGADIRTVQILLGHSKISSTQIYTHLTTDELKDMHYKYHPHGKN